MRHPAVGVIAVVLIAICWALVMVPPAANQNAHFATVTALARGSSNIDAEHNWTGDTAYLDGHFFAAKAPGLALVTVPYYLVLDRLGVVPDGPAPDVPFPKAESSVSPTALWEVALWGAVLPALALLLLVRATVDRLTPGYGTIAALAVGGASIVGVLATVFFDHALSACLGFAAFALLVARPPSRRTALAAGVLAGLAVAVELPLALVAILLGVALVLRPVWRSESVAYAVGVAIGVVPLLAFNAWAFGSPFTLAYSKAVSVPGATGHDVLGQNSPGFFGVGVPRLHGMAELLFSAYGLVVLAPVWALAILGLVFLWRDGWRWEAGLVAVIAGAFFLYNAGYTQLFGALSSGPRFLAPTIPFLALPLAAAWRRLPITAAVLCAASIVMTWTMIVANPMASTEDPGGWFRRLEQSGGRGATLSGTVFHWLWNGARPAQFAIVLALVVAAFTLAGVATPWRVGRDDMLLAVGALIAWRIVYVSAVTLLKVDEADHTSLGAVAASLVVGALVVALTAVARRRYVAAVPAIGLAPLMSAHVAGKPSAAAVLATLVLVVSTTAWFAVRTRAAG